MTDLEHEALARDHALDLLELHRPDLVSIGKATALQLVLANGQVTSVEVLQHMRAAGHGAAMDAVDPRWAGAIFRTGWYRVGYAPLGSHCRPVSVWARTKP